MYVRRAGFEAATTPCWSEAQAVVEAVFHRWPPLSKTTTCHGRRAGERGEQAGAQAQPRARALSPHGQPVRRAGSEKVFATRHRFAKKRQESALFSRGNWTRGDQPNVIWGLISYACRHAFEAGTVSSSDSKDIGRNSVLALMGKGVIMARMPGRPLMGLRVVFMRAGRKSVWGLRREAGVKRLRVLVPLAAAWGLAHAE